MRSLSFHAGLSQINNLCNILSQSVHSNSLVANWHLTHYCIKVIFCGNNLWILCIFFSLNEQNQQTSRGKEWRVYKRSQDILTCNSRNNINANICLIFPNFQCLATGIFFTYACHEHNVNVYLYICGIFYLYLRSIDIGALLRRPEEITRPN